MNIQDHTRAPEPSLTGPHILSVGESLQIKNIGLHIERLSSWLTRWPHDFSLCPVHSPLWYEAPPAGQRHQQDLWIYAPLSGQMFTSIRSVAAVLNVAHFTFIEFFLFSSHKRLKCSRVPWNSASPPRPCRTSERYEAPTIWFHSSSGKHKQSLH